jgi:hypothetical protein
MLFGFGHLLSHIQQVLRFHAPDKVERSKGISQSDMGDKIRVTHRAPQCPRQTLAKAGIWSIL